MKTYTEYYINEGFWSWLGSLIKSLFTDDTTEETKNYTKTSLKVIQDSNKKLIKPAEDILSKTSKFKAEEFIKELKDSSNKLVNDKIMTEDESVKYQLTILSIAIRIKNDSKETDYVKELKTYFDELAKNNTNLAKELTKELKSEKKSEKNKEDKDKDKDKDKNKIEQANEKLLEIFNKHKKVIDEITKKTKTQINTDNIIKYSNEKDITDPTIVYSLILISLGKQLVGDEKIINVYVDNLKTKIS